MKKLTLCTVLLSLGCLVVAGCAEEEKKTGTTPPAMSQEAADAMEKMFSPPDAPATDEATDAAEPAE